MEESRPPTEAEQTSAAAEKVATTSEVKMSGVYTASDAEEAFVFSDEKSAEVIRQVTFRSFAHRHSHPRLKMHA